MGAVNEKALSKLIGILEVAPYTTGTPSYTRLGSVRGMVNENTYDVTDIKADDTGTVLSLTKPGVAINLTFLENADADVMDILLPGTKTVVASSPVPVIGEALGTGWTVGQPIRLANKDGDNTEVASIVIDHASTPLVLNTDYNVYVGDGTNGELGYTYIVPITARAGVLDADYSYTPNASKKFEFIKEQVEMPRLIVRVTGVEPATLKERVVTLSDSRFDGSYNLDFLDIVEAGDLNGSDISFILQDGGTFTYNDGVNV